MYRRCVQLLRDHTIFTSVICLYKKIKVLLKTTAIAFMKLACRIKQLFIAVYVPVNFFVFTWNAIILHNYSVVVLRLDLDSAYVHFART